MCGLLSRPHSSSSHWPAGSKSGDAGSELPRVERCIERLLQGAGPEELATTEADTIRRYVRVTYCAPFASRGWVYDDGALSIAAQRWLEDAGSEVCESAQYGGQSETAPCEELGPRDVPQVIDCAILRHVRRSEVREYVGRFPRDVECDDGTPVNLLGVP